MDEAKDVSVVLARDGGHGEDEGEDHDRQGDHVSAGQAEFTSRDN